MRSGGRVVRRDQLEHLIGAAGGVLGEDTVVVIGSQAILVQRLGVTPVTADKSAAISMRLTRVGHEGS